MKKAVAHAREGNGPYFVEAMTYRYRGHSMADPELYRLKDEVEQYRKKDCIERLKAVMQKAGYLDEPRLAEIAERVEKVVNDSIEFSEKSPQPALDTLFDHITKEPADG
jgi:pyruvate dehydrogenase E1 component alpha subunit